MLGVLLAKEKVDYKKKDGTHVDGYNVSFGIKPRKPGDGYEGFKLHTDVWVSRETDLAICDVIEDIVVGQVVDVVVDSNRFGRKFVDELEAVDTIFFDLNDI